MSTAGAMMLLVAAAAFAQGQSSERPTQSLTVRPGRDAATEFAARVKTYADLRTQLESGLPIRVVTTIPPQSGPPSTRSPQGSAPPVPEREKAICSRRRWQKRSNKSWCRG